MVGFLDVCRFTPTLGGTTDWTYSSALVGYQSPTVAGAINGLVYRYRAESADQTQWEIGYGAYNSGTGVFARTTVLFNSSGGTSKINFTTVPQVAIVALGEDLLRNTVGIQNGTVVVSGTTSSTRSLKTLAGNDPSPQDPVTMVFPDGSQASVTAALSLTIPSTGTFGTTSGVPFKIWDALVNDSGTIRFASKNCSDANGTYAYPANGLLTSTIVTTPNSSGIAYTSTAVTAKPYLLLGYSAYESGQATAGTWLTAPSAYVIYVPGMPTPGQPTGVSAQFTTTTTYIRTAASWGDSTLTLGITLSSAANLVDTFWSGGCQMDTAAHTGSAALRRGGSVIGQQQRWGYGAANMIGELSNSWMDSPGVTNPTYVVSTQVDSITGSPTFYFMSSVGGGIIKLVEIMG